jgi:hypothetical protein
MNTRPMVAKPGLTREFWVGFRNALIPSLLLWWLIIWAVGKAIG